MIKHFRHLLDDSETVIRVNLVSAAIFFLPFVYVIIGALAALFHPIMMVTIWLMSSVPIIAALIHYKTTKLVLTDKKVIMRHGFFSRDWVVINFERIENAYVEEPILGRMFGFSTVHIGGIGSLNIAVPLIRDADNFVIDLEKCIERNNQDYMATERSNTAVKAASY
jgi:uncharacterized membrane protein YdbT with pleckstrin-like domain